MKILAFGDAHGDWTTGGLERHGEVARAFDQVFAHAVSRRVDRVIFLGDLSDPDRDTTLAHRTVALGVDLGRRLTSAGIPSDWLVGNHDVIEDGLGSHMLMALEKAGLCVHARHGNQITKDRAGRTVEFVWLPYTGRTFRYDPADYVRELALSKRLGLKGGALVVAGHMTRAPGGQDGSETRDMPRGSDMAFPTEAVAELKQAGGYDRAVLLNGHFHRRSLGQVLFPGSLARLTHGEEDHEPGFLVVEV